MAEFVQKNYDNSYLFNKDKNDMNKHHRVLIDFILKSGRIDKNSGAFSGIAEEVKRYQTSSVLYTVLMMDNVVLCINNVELPRAFKVFEAQDVRLQGGPKVFIDVTGIVTLKDGYFYCNKIDTLVTYLFGALSYLLYRVAPLKMISNSNISIAGTECFVSMTNYIIDYLRIIGYSVNKSKISYLAGLYFLHHMMGKDLDNYTKNIAAKVAGISPVDIKPFDLYFKEEDFTNIDTFVKMITETFKLKGLTTEVFINKWLYQFGTGTQYGTELFTSFSVILTNAYCGSYVVNQKQIERCCGNSMVKYSVALLKLGVDVFDNKRYMEAAGLEEFTSRDRATLELRESFLKRLSVPKDCKFEKEDFASKSKSKQKIKKMIDYYISTNQSSKLSAKITSVVYSAMRAEGLYNVNGTENTYEKGVIEILLKDGKEYLNDKNKQQLASELKYSIDSFPDLIKQCNENGDKDKAKRFAEALIELRQCKKYV